jgi:hypothetical protein
LKVAMPTPKSSAVDSTPRQTRSSGVFMFVILHAFSGLWGTYFYLGTHAYI